VKTALPALLLLASLGAACAQNPVNATGAPATDPAAEPATSPSLDDATPAPPAPTPGERYWQLRFLEGITTDVDDDLRAALEARYGPPDGTVPAIPDLATYQGAGYRIASAESILASLSDLAAFREAAGADVDAELRRIETESPEIVATIDQELLAEEILLVRSAVLDSLELMAANGALDERVVEDYQGGTVRARNELEYLAFAREMDALADGAIEESAGRLDAFHRLLDDTENTAFLRERVLAAEEMNRQLTDEHRAYAARRTARTLFFLLPALSSYFRYR
jgi:hypothetical protein